MQVINTNLSPIYKIDENQLIGQGCFGEVYKCKNIENENLELVIKLIKLNKINVEISEIYIYREIRIMQMLDCNHSVKFYESGKLENYYAIVMEYCNGNTLKNLMEEKGKFSKIEIKEILTQLNEVFKIMNNKHIIHRDLKPDNIFINYPDPNNKNKFVLKLGDFGFSRELNNSLQANSAIGSPLYASPQLLKNLAYEQKIPYSSKTDLWSLGVIIYQLYFGENPFNTNVNNKGYAGYYNNIINQKKPFKKILENKKLQDLLDKIFEIDEKNRISWNNYFQHPFFVENNEEFYLDIKEFDLGDNLQNNGIFSCFTAINKNSNEKVLVKKYNNLFCQNNFNLFKDSIQHSNDLKNNKFSLNLKHFFEKDGFWFIEYEFVDGQLLSNYLKNNSFNEKELQSKIQIFFSNLINEIDIKNIYFSILTIDSLIIDKKGNLILFDFGFLKSLLPQNIQNEYFISSPLENNYLQKNTNVLNFGIILYKIFFKQNLTFKNEKEINLPNKPKISKEFLNFLSHCLYRKCYLRYKWSDFRNDYWLYPEKINKNVLKNRNLKEILDYFEKKYEIIYQYFIDNKNFIMEFLFEKYLFVIFILIEFNMIINLFDENKNNFNEQEEFFFLEKNKNNQKYEFASVELNKFKFSEIFETENNEKNIERLNFLNNFKNNLINQNIKEKLENLFKSLLTFEELSNYKNLLNKNKFDFVENYIDCFQISDYYNLLKNFIINNKKISQYYCEYVIIMQIYLSSHNFKNNNDFTVINNMFESEKLAISLLENDKKKKFLFFSCIGGMFKFYQSSAKKNKKKIKNIFYKYQYEDYLKAYPNILVNNLKF